MEFHGDKIITIDSLYTEQELDLFKEFIDNKIELKENIPFTTEGIFENGKIIHEWSKLMDTRIKSFFNGYIETCKYIFYSKITPGQQFGIHTDTGCVFDQKNNKFSRYTCLTYLNEDYEGGFTKFYDDNFNETITIVPKRNRTLIFDISLFHCGTKVIKGTKYWIGTELVNI
jgi:hypothetical protein